MLNTECIERLANLWLLAQACQSKLSPQDMGWNRLKGQIDVPADSAVQQPAAGCHTLWSHSKQPSKGSLESRLQAMTWIQSPGCWCRDCLAILPRVYRPGILIVTGANVCVQVWNAATRRAGWGVSAWATPSELLVESPDSHLLSK